MELSREITDYKKSKRKSLIFILVLVFLLVLFFFFSLLIGSSSLSIKDSFLAIFYKGTDYAIRIIYKIRLPRLIAGVLAGIGLAISGLIMQTTLKNPLASPSTLGVSEAAVFGANLAIIVFSNIFDDKAIYNNPYLVSSFAFIFALLTVFLVLALGRIKKFSPEVIILTGVGISALFQAFTTIIQYFSTDNSLSNAIFWTFGDLGRASYEDDLILFIVIAISLIIFLLFSKSYNAMLLGDEVAMSLGINLKRVRFISLFLASLITATCIAFLGIIGFIGIISPHIVKRIIGSDHRFNIIASGLMGALILLIADTISRVILNGSSLPVGAVTAIIGAPFFIYIIFTRRGKSHARS